MTPWPPNHSNLTWWTWGGQRQGCPPFQWSPMAGTTGCLATEGRRIVDAKGQAGDRPTHRAAWHPQGRSPDSQKPATANFWSCGTFKFQNKEASRKWAEGKQCSLETDKDAHVLAHPATPRIPAEGPALSVCRAALQRRGRTDPNEIMFFKMSIN